MHSFSEFTRGFTDDDDDDYSRPAGFDSNERLGDAPGELRRECPFRWQGWGDNCYVFETIGKQWSQAEKACAVAAEGAHLASVTTKEELDFIFALVSDGSWIPGGDPTMTPCFSDRRPRYPLVAQGAWCVPFFQFRQRLRVGRIGLYVPCSIARE